MGKLPKLLFLFIMSLALAAPAHAFEDILSKEEIPLTKMGGVYHLPVELNGILNVMFILDTGAAEMSVTSEVVQTLMESGTLKKEDFIDDKTYILADGTRVSSPRFIIRKIKIGNRVLRNVPATISDNTSPLLLGQSLLEKIGSYTFDSKRQVLVLYSDTHHERGDPIPKPNLSADWKYSKVSKELNETEDVVKVFFQSVATEHYEISWQLLSTYSQNAIVAMVAAEAESPPDMIRELFEANHSSVQRGFWTSFRDASRIPSIVPVASYHQLERVPGVATVQVQVGSEELRFEVYEEDGHWKLGLIESIERFRSLKKKKH